MSAWGAQLVQVVWFPSTQLANSAAATLFAAAAPTVPVQVNQSVPSIQAALVAGISGGIEHRIQVQPGRVDLMLSPVPNPSAPGVKPTIPLIGNTLQIIKDLATPFAAASPLVGDVVRLALIVNTVHEVASAAGGVALVAQAVGFRTPFSDAQDVVFQINRRKQLQSIQGCDMNRLVKWAVETPQVIMIVAGGVPAVHSLDVVTFSADLNTVPGARVFPVNEQILMFGELCAEAERLSGRRSLDALQ